MGWWVVVGGVGVQTHLHVKPDPVELERTLAMRCEVGCVLPWLFLSIWKTKSGKAPSWLHLWLAFSTNAQNSKIREVVTAPLDGPVLDY